MRKLFGIELDISVGVGLTNCPKCKAEVMNPFKTWSMAVRSSQVGDRWKLTMGIFECPSCGARFRAMIGKEGVSIKGMVERIKGIEEAFMQVLKNLREKIRALETERASLLAEIEELKKEAEARASALESEVSVLRKEAKALKELLGHAE